MLTNLAKSLAVLVTVLAIAFMGTAVALSFTSPPFEQQAGALTDYSIRTNPQTETTPLTYTGVRLEDEQEVVTSPVLAEVLEAVYKDKAAQAQAKLDTIQREKSVYETQLEAYAQTIAPDQAAMDEKVEQLRAELARLRQERTDVATRIGQRQEDIETLLRTAEARRADVFRLRATLQQARSDRSLNEGVVQQLEDLIVQIEGDLVKARRRVSQLDQQLDGDLTPEVDVPVQQAPPAENPFGNS